MIDKTFVYNKVIPLIKEKGKKIDVLLIQNLFEDKELDIINELLTYQNEDFGLGHGLEPDIQMPFSSVAATDHGVVILENIKDKSKKQKLIEQLVSYYEDVYDYDLERFVMVDKRVDDFPHAIWWNYKDILDNFPFGNPDPEVIGFLYQNRQYLKKLNINKMINKVIDYIMSDNIFEAGMHQLISVSYFYKRVDQDVKNLIRDRLIQVIDSAIEKDLNKWDEYVLEPFKIYIIAPDLCINQGSNLKHNLEFILEKINTLSVQVSWQWYRDETVFEQVKNEWLGYLYFTMIKALRYHREL